MAYRLPRRRSSRIPIIILLFVLLACVVAVAVFLMNRDGGQPVSEPVASETASLPAPSEAPDTTGDVIFKEGEGFDLLSVVNKTYLIPEGLGEPELVVLSDEVTAREGGNYRVDARVAEPLAEFLSAARSAGYIPIVWSAYRTYEYQNGLYERAIASYIEEHPGSDRTEAIAGVTDVAPPGTSEHCTGLAVDIYTWKAHAKYKHLDRAFSEDPLAQWMKENAHKYGFILRYPDGKEDVTGITFEPWHFRYVGVEKATEIYEKGVTLEEFTKHPVKADTAATPEA